MNVPVLRSGGGVLPQVAGHVIDGIGRSLRSGVQKFHANFR